MKIMLLFLFLSISLLCSNDATIPRIYSTGHYYTIDVEHVDMENWQLQEWNQYQQIQIDSLSGKVNDLTHNNLLLQANLFNLAEYTANSQAGTNALSCIDFGNIKEGHFSIGLGFGISEPINGFQGKAGAVGVKYNFGTTQDVTVSGVAKGWSSGNHGSGGVGVIIDF